MNKTSFVFAAVMVVALVFAGWSCKKSATTDTGSKTSSPQSSVKTYQIGQTFTAGNNLEFKVDKVEKITEVKQKMCGGFEECTTFKPEKGTYLVMYLTFKGNASNETAGYDVDAIKIVDSQGKQYGNIEPHGAIDNYRMTINVENLSFAMINNPEAKQYMEMYDIPSDAKGLKAQWTTLDTKNNKVVVEAQVDLGI